MTETVASPYPWQSHAWQHVANQLHIGKLPHALLLRGPAGTGKVHFARAVAQRLLCAAPLNGLACGECKYCKLYVAGTHPDFCAVQPEDGSRAIKVEQIRDLIAFATRKAQFDGYRVVVLHPAEAMNVNSSNALLKSLEEPGVNTLIMLVTHQASQLLPTVRSRCQSIEFPVPDAASVLPWLAAELKEPSHAQRLLTLAGGCPVKARSLAAGDWQKQRDHTFEVWWAFHQKKANLVESADAIAKYPLVDVLEWLAGWHVDLARMSLDTSAPLLDEERRSLLLPYANPQTAEQLFANYDRIMELRAAFMRGANLNPQMALEGLLGALKV